MPASVYVALLIATCFERLAELVVAQRNARWSSRAAASRPAGATTPRWSCCTPGCSSAAWSSRGGGPVLRALARGADAALAVAAQGLRWWCVRTWVRAGTPGSSWCRACRWSSAGPYRWFRHPNYVAVVAEGVALPLAGSAWVTAVVFTVLNAALLTVRLRCEVAALAPARSLWPDSVAAGTTVAGAVAETVPGAGPPATAP